jgi:ribosomal-protein-alanine N-acetyltransferase
MSRDDKPLYHTGTLKIETDRLILRQLWFDDAVPMFQNWAGDPEVTRFLSWPPYKDVHGVLKFISKVNNEYIGNRKYLWAICLKGKNGTPSELIGTIGVHNLKDEVKDGEVGYVIGRKWWGRGFVPEALRAVIEFMFERVGLESLRAFHDTNNPNSGWVMEKCGMKYDGTLRHYARNNTGICNVAAYSILKSEWITMH